MGFKTQRQYETSIMDYEIFKEAVWKNRKQIIGCDFSAEDEKGNFTFYLKKYPEVRIQMTSRQHFLKLHGVKPDGFLLDLNVIRELTSLLKQFYPHGIDFRLDKETYSWQDKSGIIERQKGIIELLNRMFHRALESHESFVRFKEGLWEEYDTNLVARNQLAEGFNNCFAGSICRNGFRCKSNGLLKYHFSRETRHMKPFLERHFYFLLKSGFLM